LNHGQVYVLDNECPHAGGSLSAGPIDDGCVVCPRHYWSFRLDNGEMRDMPGVAISIYKSRLFEREGQSKLVQADLPIY
jgi:nitrite reductase (NADH) small subunit/3-phenylpropionate/trans-cinnamate dioxygenase ferredoxin subunit